MGQAVTYYTRVKVAQVVWMPAITALFLRAGAFESTWLVIVWACGVLASLAFFVAPWTFQIVGGQVTVSWLWRRKRRWPASALRLSKAESIIGFLLAADELHLPSGRRLYLWARFLNNEEALRDAIGAT